MNTDPEFIALRRTLRWGLCLLLAVCGEASSAPGPAGLATEEAYFSPIPMVVTASRLSQPLNEAPASVTVIDREMIEASGFIEIADLLRLVPGFQVTMSPLDHVYAARYHGSNSYTRRMEVLVDGRSVLSSVFAVDWHGLGVKMEDIERIEVVRGPSSPAYGANALIATVNIITHQPYQDPGLFARATTGSRDTHSGMLRYAGGDGGLDYRLSLGYDETDGFEGRNDEKIVRSANLRAQYTPTSSDVLDIHLGLRNGPVGRGGDVSIVLPERPIIGQYQRDTDYQQLRWSHVLEPGRDTYIQVYRQYGKLSDPFSLGPLSNLLGVPPAAIPLLFPGHQDEEIGFSIYDYTEERFDLEWQYNDLTETRLQWSVGAGLRLERMKNFQYLAHRDYADDFSQRLFGHAAWHPADGWVLNLGGMLEHGDMLDTEFSYRIGLNRLLTPDHSLRASVTSAVRRSGLNITDTRLGVHFADGDTIDMFLYVSGIPDPEEMLAYELGYLGSWMERRLTLDIKAFREEIRNELRARNDPEAVVPELIPNGAFLGLNGGGVDLTGLEAQLQYRPRPGTLVSLQYALTQADDRYDPGAAGLPSREQDTPRHTLSLLLAHRLPWDLEASLGYYYLDRMNWGGDGNSSGGPVDAYDRLDLRLARRFRWTGAEGLLELIGQNVGTGTYVESRPENRFDSRLFLRASLQLD